MKYKDCYGNTIKVGHAVRTLGKFGEQGTIINAKDGKLRIQITTRYVTKTHTIEPKNVRKLRIEELI